MNILILLIIAIVGPGYFLLANTVNNKGTGKKPNWLYYAFFEAITIATAIVAYTQIKSGLLQALAVVAVLFACKYLLGLIQKNQSGAPTIQSSNMVMGASYRQGSMAEVDAKSFLRIRIGSIVVALLALALCFVIPSFLHTAVMAEGIVWHIIGTILIIASPVFVWLATGDYISSGWAPFAALASLGLGIAFCCAFHYPYNF